MISQHQEAEISSFEYQPGEDRDRLQEAAGRIRSHIASAKYHFQEIGRELIQSEPELKDEGRFMQWCEYHFGADLSYTTLRNYMNVVSNLSEPMIADPQTAQSAKYILARPTYGGDPPEQWRLDAGERLAQHHELDTDSAKIIRYAPEPLVASFLKKETPKSQLVQFINGLNDLKKHRRAYAELIFMIERWGVQRIEMLDFLKDVYLKWKRSQHRARPAETWQALIDDEGVMNGIDWAIPVGHPEAHLRIRKYRADRQFMHMLEADRRAKDEAKTLYTWSENRIAAVILEEGDQVYLMVDPDLAARMKDDFPNGGSVLFTIRLPLKEKE
jgi:hypothetical protein